MTFARAKEIYEETGKYFFSDDTMRFWDSRIESGLIGERYFITSEDNFNRTERRFSIRQFNEDYTDIDTVEFQTCKTLREAKSVLEAICEEDGDDEEN